MANKIRNPILKGFNPDPTVVRVGEDYYVATSTFEWFPGVQIHHSRDLVNWELIARPLDRVSQLDMRGIPNSGGVWAPCLSWHDGTFYLCYSNVKELNSVTKDSPNYLVTARDIRGPWSEPVYLNASGFDPSLFHAPDNRKWLLNMVWDHRPGRSHFYGIHIQEYDHERRQLLDKPVLIFKGTELDCTEGPHLYFRNGYYYLITAEGGTELGHAVTIARSRNITGPYEVHPFNPILTSRGRSDLELQKVGHGDLVETPDGSWYLFHLCARPLNNGRCILGRETGIQKIRWDEDDWPYLSNGNNRPSDIVHSPIPANAKQSEHTVTYEFQEKELPIDFQTPRSPLGEESMSLKERPGFLRLKGGHSLQSKYEQVLVARRLQDFQVRATTLLEFEPESFQHMAGLVCYYSTRLFHYLYMSHDEQRGTCLYVQSNIDGTIEYPLGNAIIPLNNTTRVYLRVEVDHKNLTFFYSLDGHAWEQACNPLDASILSDDFGEEWGFTGTFVGMACQDLTGMRKHADFNFFEYMEIDA